MVKGERIQELSTLKNLVYSTVRIQVEETDGEEGVGTGFFFHFPKTDDNEQTFWCELVVTNKHMIKGIQKGKLVFHIGPIIDGFPTGNYELTIENLESKFVIHPDPDIDLCAIDISPYLEEIKQATGKELYYQPLSYHQLLNDDELKKLFPIADVYMVGYPTGLWDQKNNLPLARRGVTASHPYFDFNDKSKGVVDIATFPGSSGSPIIIFQQGGLKYQKDGRGIMTLYTSEDEFSLLGILSSGAYMDAEGQLIVREIPAKKVKVPSTEIMIHLGYYIKAKELLAFETLF